MSRAPDLSEESRSAIAHCLAKVEEIAAETSPPGPMRVLQLGYNLGRLSELSALGREVFWDAWKIPVDSWDGHDLQRLVEDLRRRLDPTGSESRPRTRED